MTFDLQKILASKLALRHTLATRDILEKLRILDALRERTITLRASSPGEDSARVREDAQIPGFRP